MQLVDGDLHGRADDVRRVCQLLRNQARLVTLTGVGGVGKTVLAQQVVRELVGSNNIAHHWLELPGSSETDALGRLQEKANEVLDRHSGENDLLPLLAIDTAPEARNIPIQKLLRSILGEFPGLQILMTSRARLRLSLERVVDIKPFELPTDPIPADPGQLVDFVNNHTALEFLLSRVEGVVDNVHLDHSTVSGFLAICRRLGGLPLALQMASLKCNVLPAAAMLAELDRSLAILEDFEPDSPTRHRSMYACLSSNIDDLTQPEMDLVSDVATFPGGCALASLGALNPTESEGNDQVHVLSRVSMLVEQQVLCVLPDRSGAPRVTTMPLVRDYLQFKGSYAPRKRELAQILIAEARTKAAARGSGGDLAREWFDNEYVNLMQCLDWFLEDGDFDLAADLVYSLHLYWLHRGLLDEGLLATERLLKASGLSKRSFAKVMSTMGGLRAHLTSFTSVYVELLSAVDLWRDAGSPSELGNALMAFSTAAFEVDGFEASASALREALQIFDVLDDGWAHARALALLGAAAANEPDRTDYARGCLEEASAALLSHGDEVAASLPFEQLGRLLLDDGDYEQARVLLEHGFKDSSSVGDQVQASAFLNLMALAEAQSGRFREAAQRYLESLDIAVRWGLRSRAVWCLEGIAESLEALGQLSAATVAVTSANGIRDELGLEYWVEFCCPKRPRLHVVSESPATRLAALNGAAWPPSQIFDLAQKVITDLSADEQLQDASPLQNDEGLTRRESEILRLVAGGFTNQDIADQLVISLDTVKRHISNLYRKIGARGRAEATAYAWHNKLVSDPTGGLPTVQ